MGDCELKVVITGDRNIGKTNVLTELRAPGTVNLNDVCSTPAVGVSECCWRHCTRDADDAGYDVGVELFDQCGHEALQGLRLMMYEGTDILLLAFDMRSAESLQGLPLWLEEFTEAGHQALIVMVGCKSDLWLKDQSESSQVGKKQPSLQAMNQMAWELGAHDFVRTSAKTCKGLHPHFELDGDITPDDIAGEEQRHLWAILLDLNHRHLWLKEPAHTLCEQQMWLPWEQEVSIALAMGAGDPGSPLATLRGNVRLQRMIWLHVNASKNSVITMLCSPEAVLQREIDANEKESARVKLQKEMEANEKEEARAQHQEEIEAIAREMQTIAGLMTSRQPITTQVKTSKVQDDGCCIIG